MWWTDLVTESTHTGAKWMLNDVERKVSGERKESEKEKERRGEKRDTFCPTNDSNSRGPSCPVCVSCELGMKKRRERPGI